jgi:hypothetical protein
MHWISGLPDIQPDNPAFFLYPDGYQIALPDIRPNIQKGWIPDI